MNCTEIAVEVASPTIPGLGRAAIVLSLLALLLTGGRAEAAPAASADDVCAPDSDPCVVKDVFDVVDGSTLDFHTRTLEVRDGGQFNFGAGSGTLRCGDFDVSTRGSAIVAKGATANGQVGSGMVTVRAQRLCSGGGSTRGCVDGTDCQLGLCDARRCSLNPRRLCSDDSGCQLGICGANRRCSNSAIYTRCSTNADCDLGTCPAQLTCHGSSADVLDCSSDADCDLGTCSIGSASITLDGGIVGSSTNPASMELLAADSVRIAKPIALDSLENEADGGFLTVVAGEGDLTVDASIAARGGSAAQGGAVFLQAGQDVVVNAAVNVNGGDFDGGSVEIDSGRDIHVGASLLASSRSGAGYGGAVLFDAGRDLLLDGGAGDRRTRIEASGHTSKTRFSGDGGTLDYAAARDLTIGSRVEMTGRGSAPDGYGADVYLSVGGDFVFDGKMNASSRGAYGKGGYIEAVVGGTTSVGAAAFVDLRGGAAGGGDLLLDGTGDLAFAGSADLGAGHGADDSGRAFLRSHARTSISGDLALGGSSDNPVSGHLDIIGCRVVLEGSASIRNDAIAGSSQVLSYESMSLQAGSELLTPRGTNTLVYRSPLKPPVLAGLVSPAAALVLDETLTGCPVCGNAEIDQGETCDDGNVVPGDGCSDTCQVE